MVISIDQSTQQSLPHSAPAEAGTTNRPQWWRDWRKLTAAGAGGLLLILLGIWVIIRDREGNEVTRVPVPEGGSVTLESGQPASSPAVWATKPVPLPPWNLPPGSPPPAIAPFGSAKAKEHQTAWAEHLGASVESENSIGMQFVLIPPGEFDMGSTEDEVARLKEEAKAKRAPWRLDRLRPETPNHRVRITEPFWLSRHEVTRGQFRRFVDDCGYQTEAERDGKGGFALVDGQWVEDPRFVWNADLCVEQADDHPVVNVSWNDVTAFCEWLSEKEGVTCHLPSEAQWEYACRAGTRTFWHCGNNETTLQECAWFGANSGRSAHPVGQLWPNAWGLYDMHGNVREWCEDWHDKHYYASSPPANPLGPKTGSGRVRRGGSWLASAWYCRSAFRFRFSADRRACYMGFRVARSPSGK